MFKSSKMKFLSLGLAAAMAFTMTGCGGSDTDSNGSGAENGGATENAGRDRLVVAINAEPRSLDLHGSNDANSSQVNVQIFETLVRQDVETMEILPGLATDWRQIDDLTWEFDLREDVYFHNGEKFTAEDVYWTFQRALDSVEVAVIMDQIDPDGITIIDEYTIQIATVEPFAPLLAHLAHSAAGIMNQVAVEAVEAEGGVVGQNPVGTGPFQFVRWVSGDFVELERFDDYWGELPAFRELVIRTVIENNARATGLETGEIDIALALGAPERRVVEGHSNLELITAKGLSTSYIGFNMTQAPFDDVRVRQAISYAVDVDSIVEFILEGVGQPATGPIGSNVWGARDDLQMYDYNVERAKELLAEAGLEDGFKTYIWVSDNQTNIDIVTRVRNQLLEIGIEAEIQTFDWPSFQVALETGDHHMFIMAWGSVTGDADYGLLPLFHSEVDPSGGNRVHMNNPELDALLDRGRATANPQERLAIYAEAQEIIVAEAPMLWIAHGEVSAGMQSDVRGFVLNPANHHRFAGVYFE